MHRWDGNRKRRDSSLSRPRGHIYTILSQTCQFTSREIRNPSAIEPNARRKTRKWRQRIRSADRKLALTPTGNISCLVVLHSLDTAWPYRRHAHQIDSVVRRSSCRSYHFHHTLSRYAGCASGVPLATIGSLIQLASIIGLSYIVNQFRVQLFCPLKPVQIINTAGRPDQQEFPNTIRIGSSPLCQGQGWLRRISSCRKEVLTTMAYQICLCLDLLHQYRPLSILILIFLTLRSSQLWLIFRKTVQPSMVLILNQWMLIVGSLSFLPKSISDRSRTPWQQSNSSVELPCADSIPPFIEDQAAIADYFLPKPTSSFGSTHDPRTHSLPNLISTKSLRQVNSRFKLAKAIYTSRHRSLLDPCPRLVATPLG